MQGVRLYVDTRDLIIVVGYLRELMAFIVIIDYILLHQGG